MANPPLTGLAAGTVADVLIEAQLGSGNNDYVVPASTAWKLESLTLCNDTASPVTVDVAVRRASGGTFRKVVSGFVLASKTAGDGKNTLGLDVGRVLPRQLPEGAVLRVTSSAATAVDVLATGTVLA